jgi:N-formylglutamate amidohydrolase
MWVIEEGAGPFVATAIHDGHEVRDEVLRHMAIDEASRLREEDPWTAGWTAVAPNRVVGLRSRFEVDLNRPREKAVYLTPDDAWGLNVWNGELPPEIASRSQAEYDAFYAALCELYSGLAARHRRFIVFDLHTYNHRRDGPGSPEADPLANPQVNVGTGTMADRRVWAPVIDRFVADLSAYDFSTGPLDVRENIRFRGGHHSRWAHETFPDTVCVLSIEVKKFFMDEWTGEVDQRLHREVGQALDSTVPGVLEEMARL